MAQAFIGLGSNLGDRKDNLRRALEVLQADPRIIVRRVSRFVETRPRGGPPQGNFLNAAAELQSDLSPRELLKVLLETEAQLGRVRTETWGPRTIDLDLLLYEDRIVQEADLLVPHPLMHQRKFVLKPLSEIAPDALHPVLKKSVRQLLQDLD